MIGRLCVVALVRLLPFPFRHRLGAEIVGAWEDGRSENLDRGRIPAAVFTMKTLIGLVRCVALERWRPTLLQSSQSRCAPGPADLRPGADLMDRWVQDLRYAFRSLAHSWGFSAVAVVVLGLAVGAVTALFGVVHGVLLRPLPFPEPDGLVAIGRTSEGRPTSAMSLPDLDDLAEEGAFFEVMGYYRTGLTWTDDRPEVVPAARVSTGPLGVFGVAPALGRDLRRDENVPGGPRVALVGHSFWQERLGADPEVVGRRVELDEEAFEIVGVAPRGFAFPEDAAIWIPQYTDIEDCGRGCHLMRAVARLAVGVGLESATVRAEALSIRLEEAYPESNHDKRFVVRSLREVLFGDVERPLWVLFAAVVAVLLIACANVANLLLVRATRRKGEMAIRAALGGRPRRLASQLLLESLVLASAAGALGLAVAHLGLRVLLHLAPADLPRLDEVQISVPVLLFGLALVLGVSVLFGLAPTLRLSRVPAATVLRQGGRGAIGDRGGDRLRSLLLIVEVALSVFLLLGAGLLLRSFQQMNEVELGFASDRLSLFTVSLPEAGYPEPELMVRFFETLESDLLRLPGVEAVGSVFGSPLGRNRISGGFQLLDRPAAPEGQEPAALVRVVTPGFMEVLELPLVAGRFLEPTDQRDQPQVAVVSRSFAERYFPGGSPIGAQLDLQVGFSWEEDESRTIVGVVGDIRSRALTQAAEPEIYVPDAQMAVGYLTVMLRTGSGAGEPLAQVREVVERLEPSIALRNVESMDDVLGRALAPARFQVVLLATFAVLAVVLAAVGLYGVIAYAVAGRTHEIALRMALGADRRDVLGLVLRQGAVPLLIGLIAGLGLTVAASRVLGSLLYEVGPRDPATFAAVVVLLGLVSVAATAFPASRATRIAPMTVLKGD